MLQAGEKIREGASRTHFSSQRAVTGYMRQGREKGEE